jgi:hypothetical protein
MENRGLATHSMRKWALLAAKNEIVNGRLQTAVPITQAMKSCKTQDALRIFVRLGQKGMRKLKGGKLSKHVKGVQQRVLTREEMAKKSDAPAA